ncbi:MAG TPA: ferrochelatase [Chloroflexia bacterium]|nr:ferrochelatase [Chloroflexia bacterium]
MTLANTEAPIGVLLMAYGGPASLDELPGYLADIRSGRPTTKAILAEMTRNYELIGGKSPLLEISRKQAAAVEKLLNADGRQAYKVYIGMRHWSPWIEDTIRDMLNDGIERAVAIVLAPHYSSMSVSKYHEKVQAGLEMYAGNIDFEYVDSYNTAPKYIQAMADRVRAGIERWPEDERESVHVILSAHSLPVRIIRMGDPYQDQLLESARLIAQKAGLRDDQWSWSYQSAGRTPEPWLGPQVEVHVAELAEKGIKNIVSVPIGFVSDHVEILFDIDIKAQGVAKEKGVRLERPPALNDDPLYIETLVDLVRERAARWQPQTAGAQAL